MSRIAACFDALRGSNRAALIPYITAGDPDLETTLALMHTLVDAGADLLEIGVPFSDPMADGPVIQAACERALEHGTSLHDVLKLVSDFRRDNTGTPVILMGYLNPIECVGYEAFAAEAEAAGVDGVLTVDIPPEEGHDYLGYLQKHGLDAIFLLSPTTTEQRIRKIANAASGFLYYVSLKGVTGAANLDVKAVEDKLGVIRGHTGLPVGVGFGIHDAQSAAHIARIADAVVVGSTLIRMIENNHDDPAAIKQQMHGMISSMREAMDRVRAEQQQKVSGA